MVRPSSWRDRPTAKSQMSMASWTSPRDSEVIFPASIVTSSATSSLCSPRSSPRRLTSAPRTGAGTARHSRKASFASAIALSTSAPPAEGTSNSSSPVIGERALTDAPVPSEGRSTPQLSRAARARERSSSVDETDSSCSDWIVVIGSSVSSGREIKKDRMPGLLGARPRLEQGQQLRGGAPATDRQVLVLRPRGDFAEPASRPLLGEPREVEDALSRPRPVDAVPRLDRRERPLHRQRPPREEHVQQVGFASEPARGVADHGPELRLGQQHHLQLHG